MGIPEAQKPSAAGGGALLAQVPRLPPQVPGQRGQGMEPPALNSPLPGGQRRLRGRRRWPAVNSGRKGLSTRVERRVSLCLCCSAEGQPSQSSGFRGPRGPHGRPHRSLGWTGSLAWLPRVEVREQAQWDGGPQVSPPRLSQVPVRFL